MYILEQIFYTEILKLKLKAQCDFWLYILFYFPGLTFLFLYDNIGFVLESIKRGERGMDTAWMPYLMANQSMFTGLEYYFYLSKVSQNYLKVTMGLEQKVSGQDEDE